MTDSPVVWRCNLSFSPRVMKDPSGFFVVNTLGDIRFYFSITCVLYKNVPIKTAILRYERTTESRSPKQKHSHSHSRVKNKLKAYESLKNDGVPST